MYGIRPGFSSRYAEKSPYESGRLPIRSRNALRMTGVGPIRRNVSAGWMAEMTVFARSIRPSASSTPVMRRPSVCRATTRLRTSIVPPCSRIFAASASAICCVPPVKRQAPSMFEWFTIAWW